MRSVRGRVKDVLWDFQGDLCESRLNSSDEFIVRTDLISLYTYTTTLYTFYPSPLPLPLPPLGHLPINSPPLPPRRPHHTRSQHQSPREYQHHCWEVVVHAAGEIASGDSAADFAWRQELAWGIKDRRGRKGEEGTHRGRVRSCRPRGSILVCSVRDKWALRSLW